MAPDAAVPTGSDGALHPIKRHFAQEYDAAADDYAAFAEPVLYRQAATPLLEALAAIPGRVLDVATGTGALGGRLSEPVVGLDLSFAQLRRNPLRRVVVGDAERLPFRNDAFAAAASAFGTLHLPDPAGGVGEMARVAPVVALSTWRRPRPTFAPREVVGEVLARHAGGEYEAARRTVERMTESIGSTEAVHELLERHRLSATVSVVPIEVPWPGARAFVGYRMAVLGARRLVPDLAAAAREAESAVAALPARALRWRTDVIVAIGRRTRP